MITTERLRLHPFTMATATAAANGEGGALPWAEGFPREDDRDAARVFLHAPHEVFSAYFVAERASDLVVGTIGFFGPPDPDGQVMVGYGLVPQARGQGYPTEALRALVAYALAQPSVTRLAADANLDNVASHRVLQKAGFRHSHDTGTARWFVQDRPGRPES